MGLRLSAQARREVIQQLASLYQQASASYKKIVLDEVVATTGYARRSAIRLLHHPPEGPRPQKRQRQRRYGPEVQHVLFLLWHQANRICSKRLIPFLPTLIEALERHHHLHLSETCRGQLLSMSAATADRLLRASRERNLGSPSTTRAGTWLKQHIPLRTFQQWNETQPGFLEVDLVAHCGRETLGSFLYTLTLTDIATGWTECLPLRSKNAEEVLSAFQSARALFPFPILGVDADNGSEFINESLLTYCEEEGITFTRGRPDLKNDQCFVEQKNGVVVRQIVGHERFEGEDVYRQLDEVYQALRLYVNCFQPSMKLQARKSDGKKVRRIYDAAKTPLQRLQLSEILSNSQLCQMLRMAQMLDPLRLFEHLQKLQQALFAILWEEAEENAPFALLSFRLQRCLAGSCPAGMQTPKLTWQQEVIYPGVPESVLPYKLEQERGSHALCSDPMAGASIEDSSQHAIEETWLSTSLTGEEEEKARLQAWSNDASQIATKTGSGPRHSRSGRAGPKPSRHQIATLTIEQAIADYLVDVIGRHRRPKTIEWHEMALGSLQQYMRTEHQCVLLCQITHTRVGGWLTFLQEHPTTTGSFRSPNTVWSYARSARAFFQWTVQKHYLQATPFAFLPLPSAEVRSQRLLSREEWEDLLLACHLPKQTDRRAEQAEARNRALLWVLFDTGIQASEACHLRLDDVDRERGVLLVRGKGSKERRLTLGQQALRHLLVYLDGYRLLGAACGEQVGANEVPLFLSEMGRPLTKSGVTLLFGRLRKRAGITRKGVTASLLRESFAARYIRVGGDLEGLREILGQERSVSFQHYLQMSDEETANEKRERR